jgi:pimeloyl-ACP methyl ester carboxylesterase
MTPVYAVLACVALASLVVTALTTVFAMRAAGRNACPPFLRGPCRGRRAACRLAGIASGFASQCLMFLTYPLGLVAARFPRIKANPGEPVVVCLHGLYHNAAAFLVLRPVLARHGLRRVLCLSSRCRGVVFEDVARDLADRLRRSVPADTPLLLVGHSLGGLLARRLAAEPDIARRVRAVVTLGAPHHGSALAVLALGRLGRSLLPQSPLFPALDALPDPPRVALLSLASPMDNMVIPLAGLAIDRPAWIQEATAPVSHVAMLYHPAILTRVATFLRIAAQTER